MDRIWRLRCVSMGLLCFGGWFFGSAALAAIDDSRFEISADGASVELDLREVPRRDVLERLFAARAIKLEWISRAIADEPISGRFAGTLPAVVRRLLSRTNFVLAYERSDDKLRISRVLILGWA